MTAAPSEAKREWWALINEAKAYVGPRVETKTVYATERLVIEVIEKYEAEHSAPEAALKERDEAIKRYMSIERANKEMSRNDHVHFGELLQERDEARAEIERLKAERDFDCLTNTKSVYRGQGLVPVVEALEGQVAQALNERESFLNQLTQANELLRECEIAFQLCRDSLPGGWVFDKCKIMLTKLQRGEKV